MIVVSYTSECAKLVRKQVRQKAAESEKWGFECQSSIRRDYEKSLIELDEEKTRRDQETKQANHILCQSFAASI